MFARSVVGSPPDADDGRRESEKMKKYYRTDHYRSKDKNFNIFVNWYSTKSGYLKFNIEIYAEHLHNNNGFCSRIASYNTSENAMLQYLKRNDYFELVEV